MSQEIHSEGDIIAIKIVAIGNGGISARTLTEIAELTHELRVAEEIMGPKPKKGTERYKNLAGVSLAGVAGVPRLHPSIYHYTRD